MSDVVLGEDVPAELMLLRDGDATTLVVRQNRRSADSVGSAVGLSFLEDLVRLDQREIVARHLRKPSADFDCMLLRVRCDGSFPFFRTVRVASQARPDGTVVCVTAETGRDIHILSAEFTDMRRLRDLEDFVNEAPIGLQWLSPGGRVLWANRTQLQLLGYTAEEMVGMSLRDISNDSDKVLGGNMAMLERGGTLVDHGSDWKTKSGQIRHVRLDSNLRFDENGAVLHSRCFIRDDTAKQIRAARLEAERCAESRNRVHQDRFLRRILHELRTPCSNALACMEAGSTGAASSAALEVHRIVRVLDDIRDAHLFEEGDAIVLRSAPVDLPALLVSVAREVFSEYGARFGPHSVLWSGCRESDTLARFVITDADAVMRVLRHLLDNAFRFAASPGSVLLSYRDASGEAAGAGVCEVAVMNDGAALDASAIFRVCQKYYDDVAEDARFTRSGLGLGLNLSYNVLQCLGSDLRYDRRGDVNVFHFTMKAPGCAELSRESAKEVVRSALACAKTAAPEASQEWVPVERTDAGRLNVVDAPECHVAAAVPPPVCAATGTAQVLRRAHVLVVDDNAICRRVLCKTLQRQDCTTETACDGLEAANLLLDGGGSERCDIVFMDLRMPTVDGLVATKTVRERVPASELPIIGFTADCGHEIEAECRAVGMNDFITKPASATIIRDLVAKYFCADEMVCETPVMSKS